MFSSDSLSNYIHEIASKHSILIMNCGCNPGVKGLWLAPEKGKFDNRMGISPSAVPWGAKTARLAGLWGISGAFLIIQQDSLVLNQW